MSGSGRSAKHANRGLKLGAGFMIALFLAGCSSTSKMLDDIWNDDSSTSSTHAAAASGDAIPPNLANADQAEPVAKLYNKALDELKAGSYRTAATSFGEVERQHPYSMWATKAILMQAY